MTKSLKKIEKLSKEKIKIPKSTQHVLPIDTIYQDGVFQKGKWFSKMYVFTDINFKVYSDEEQARMIELYAELLNSFDSTTQAKITINNRKMDVQEFYKHILCNPLDDNYDYLRKEMNEILLGNIADTDEIIQEKYITISTYKKSYEEARIYFSRISLDIKARFHALGSTCEEVTLKDRLKVLHDFYRNGYESEFQFDYAALKKQGSSFKDTVCPLSFEFKDTYFKMGEKYGRVLFFNQLPNYLNAEFIGDLCGLNKRLMYSMDVTTIPTEEAIKQLEKVSLGVDTNITNWQRKQNANNNFSATVPYDMEEQQKEVREYLEDLRSRDYKMLFTTITLVHLADSKEELEADTELIKSMARAESCELTSLYFAKRQMDGLNSVLPIGINRLDSVRTMMSYSASAFMPFRAQEIKDKNGMWLGQNRITNNMILCNKEYLQNPNAFVFGVPGSGKSFLSKLMVVLIAFNTNDDILICDPEGEYTALIKELNGTVYDFNVNSKCHINAMDMEEGYGENGNAIGNKSEFIIALVGQNSRNGISEIEQSLIDRCVSLTYKRVEMTGEVPTLCTLRNILLEQPEEEAKKIALKLELFTEGNLNMFAKPTNVKRDNRITSFNIHDLNGQLKKIGLSVITDAMINRVNKNWAEGRRTHLFYDEIHVLFENEYAANFLECAWRQFRKRNAFPTGITQNVDFLLQKTQARTMVSNSEFIVMLNQGRPDSMALQELLNIDDKQMGYITNAPIGAGMIRCGSSLVPFYNKVAKDKHIYRLASTKAEDLSNV